MRTVKQAARSAARRAASKPPFYACYQTDVCTSEGNRRGVRRHNLTTTTSATYHNANDWMSKIMGLGPSFAFATATGNATSSTATTLTNTGAAFPTAGQGLAGQIVYAGPNAAGTGASVYGYITSNTATVLTVDQWTNPASTTGAAGATANATASYQIGPGGGPAPWMALTADAVAPTTADTTLTTELTTNGFARAVGTWAHTAGTTTYTLTHLWTAAATVTINKEAQFGAATTVDGGVMPFESAEPSPPTLVSGDTITNVITITV